MEQAKQLPLKRTNKYMNFLKGIACFAVVFMHCEFPGRTGVVVQALTRFSVPFFFMVSGYFCYYVDLIKLIDKIPNKVKHITRIIFVSASLYIFARYLFVGINVTFIKNKIFSFFLFNQPFISFGHLWFLYALLYTYLLYLILAVLYKNSQKIYFLIPILLLAHFFIAYGAHLMGFRINNMYFRNAVFEGLPLFLLGNYIHSKEDWILQKFSLCNWLYVFIAASVLVLIERYLIGRDFSMHVFAIVQVFALFMLAVKNSELNKSNIIEKIGDKYSLFIYIMHMMVMMIIVALYEFLGVSGNVVLEYMKPIVVLLLTIGFAVLFYSIKNLVVKQR